MNIRVARPADAEALVAFFPRLYGESDFMLLDPDEYRVTPDQQRARLEELERNESGVLFVAEENAIVFGVGAGTRQSYRRSRHVLYIVLGVLTEAHHRGMGTALMLALEEWASAHGVSRMELRVDVRNVVAKALYEKLGYRVEGTRVACRMIGGRPVDEYDMAKLLPVPANVPRE